MNDKIHIEPQHFNIIEQILNQYLPVHSKVWVFGSRTTDQIKKFSDLDLVIDAHGAPLSLATLADITHAFDESDLPYKVDIIDWNTVNESFKKLIENQRILLWEN